MRRLLLPACLTFATAARGGFADAMVLYRALRYQEAQVAFEAVVRHEPANAAAHHYLGRLACLRQDFEEAVAHLERAAALQPEDPEIRLDHGSIACLLADSLGLSFRALGLARRGRQSLEHAVERAPHVIRYRLALIQFYRRAPRLVGGSLERAYAQAAAIQPIDPFAGAHALAQLDLSRDDPAAALGRWTAFLENHPDHAGAEFELGRIAAMTGVDAPSGEQVLQRALERPPEAGLNRPQAFWRLGQLQRHAGDRAAARESLRAAREFEPANPTFAAEWAALETAPGA